jgi:hypothetical protein
VTGLRAAAATAVVAAITLSCGDDGVEPTFCGGIPAALFDNVPAFPIGELRPALVDAGTRLVPQLPDGQASRFTMYLPSWPVAPKTVAVWPVTC